jgi:5'-methylthioadenosine nucleosidase
LKLYQPFFIALIYINTFCQAANVYAKPPISKVLIVVAMKEEARPLIQLLHLSPATAPDPSLPMEVYTGRNHKFHIELIIPGTDPNHGVENVGTQAAVLTTYLGINQFHPDLVINVGTAGGRAETGVKIGEIYLSSNIYFFNRRFISRAYQLYGIGAYSSMNTEALGKKLQLKHGSVCSGDSFLPDETDSQMQTKLGCMLIDMEAAGVNWVTMLKKIPMFALKGVSNYMDPASAHDEFENNGAEVTKKLAVLTKKILDCLK